MTQLLALTPPSGPWRKKLADSAVRWTQLPRSDTGAVVCPTGDPGLHQYIGELYYKGMSTPSLFPFERSGCL